MGSTNYPGPRPLLLGSLDGETAVAKVGSVFILAGARKIITVVSLVRYVQHRASCSPGVLASERKANRMSRKRERQKEEGNKIQKKKETQLVRQKRRKKNQVERKMNKEEIKKGRYRGGEKEKEKK